ncbi:MAG: prepilin-type N-terminal cleavage/methylation domain-containing protein [Candidatus Omnitrophica bacterium]|nr:prepilin-type N-terminal cleavage/methylation domain-containing protein [Candidatus Omnitrophota bacterium]
MRLKRIPGRAGFTLIEILIAITTFTIIAAAIYSSLSAGLRMWRRSNTMIGELQSARVFFSLASSDLRNAVIYNPEGVNFEGSGSGMAFMSIVTGGGRERTRGPELAKVAYYLDARTKTVKRIVAGKARGFDIYKASPAVVFGEVEDKALAFEYCYKSKFGKTGYEWKNKWQDTGKIPIGVRIRVNGLTRYIFIPTGEPG